MTPESKPRFRRLRMQRGMLLAIGWIVFWYLKLDADQRATIAALERCDGVGLWGWITCKAGRTVDTGAASASFAVGLFWTLLSAPLAFVASHYMARATVERDEAAAVRLQSAEAEAQKKEAEEQRVARAAQSQSSATKARETLDRSELVHKLGAVSDLLELLAYETNQDRMLLISQGIAKELRDLVAKHELDHLRKIVVGDESIAGIWMSIRDRLQQQQHVARDMLPILQSALRDLPPGSASH